MEKSINILVADHSSLITESVCNKLRSAGYTISRCADEKQMEMMVKEFAPALVLLEIASNDIKAALS